MPYLQGFADLQSIVNYSQKLGLANSWTERNEAITILYELFGNCV